MSPETQREDMQIGNETNRPPEVDQTGMYPASLENIRRVAKTEEDIARECQMFGKDPELVDRAQYHWDFSVPGFTQTLRVYTGTFFGDKAKATDVAAALLGHRPGKHETVTAAMLWDKPCQVLVEFDQEKGRNRITKVMPPKRGAALESAPGPAQEADKARPYAEGSAERMAALKAAVDGPAPTFDEQQKAMAGASEDIPWDDIVKDDPGPQEPDAD